MSHAFINEEYLDSLSLDHNQLCELLAALGVLTTTPASDRSTIEALPLSQHLQALGINPLDLNAFSNRPLDRKDIPQFAQLMTSGLPPTLCFAALNYRRKTDSIVDRAVNNSTASAIHQLKADITHSTKRTAHRLGHWLTSL